MLPGGRRGPEGQEGASLSPVLSGHFPGNRGQGDTVWGWVGAPHPTQGPEGSGALGEARGGAGLGPLQGNREETQVGKETLGVPGGCVWLWGRVRPSGAVTHSGGKPPPRLRSQGDGSLPDLCLPGPRPPDSCGARAPAGAQIMRHTAPVCGPRRPPGLSAPPPAAPSSAQPRFPWPLLCLPLGLSVCGNRWSWNRQKEGGCFAR